MSTLQKINFSINHWQHLYSLQQAIQHNLELTGQQLSITGQVHNCVFLQNKTSQINIQFLQVDTAPSYAIIEKKLFLLSNITHNNHTLSCEIKVNKPVFKELQNNLIEYADIEGIHIVVTLGVLSDLSNWRDSTSLPLVELDYAMKGDA